MSTVSDLGRAYKAKHPGKYDDLSDVELGRAVKRKHPGKYDDFVEEGLEVRPPTSVSKPPSVVESIASLPLPSHSADKQTDQALRELLDYYSPKRGRFSSWWQQGKAESRAKLLTVLSEEQKLVIERGAALEELVRARKKNELDFRAFVAQHVITLQELRLRESLIENALRAGLPVESHILIVEAQEQARIRIEEEKERSNIKVSEHKRLTEIDLNNKLSEVRERIRQAMISKHLSDIQMINLVNEELDKLYKQIDKIERLPDSELSPKTKQRMIEDREEIISTLKEDRRGRQQRLLENHNRGTVRGDDEDAEL